MKIGYRTMKTALGTALSILIAQSLGLQFYVSSGILTILSIQVTRKRSLQGSINRFIACLLSFTLGAVFFELLGYSPLVVGLLILVFLPILVRLRLQETFANASVIILHLYTSRVITLQFFWNELQLITVGIGVGLLMNLYMPNNDRTIKAQREGIESNFAKILREYSIYLRSGESTWDGREMIETPNLLRQAKELALYKLENDLVGRQEAEYFYFELREKQFELLERMLPIVSQLNQDVPQGRQLAEFVQELSQNIHPKNTAYIFLDKIALLRAEVKNTDLPQTREEFETRASLFYLLNEFEQYLYIKQNYLNRTDQISKNGASA